MSHSSAWPVIQLHNLKVTPKPLSLCCTSILNYRVEDLMLWKCKLLLNYSIHFSPYNPFLIHGRNVDFVLSMSTHLRIFFPWSSTINYVDLMLLNCDSFQSKTSISSTYVFQSSLKSKMHRYVTKYFSTNTRHLTNNGFFWTLNI